MRPCRIQLSRRKGWRIPANTIVVARPTKWGNPFRASTLEERKVAVAKYRAWLKTPEGKELVREAKRVLPGHNLACWCSLDGPCHADVWLEIANSK